MTIIYSCGQKYRPYCTLHDAAKGDSLWLWHVQEVALKQALYFLRQIFFNNEWAKGGQMLTYDLYIGPAKYYLFRCNSKSWS